MRMQCASLICITGARAVTITYASEPNFLYHIQCTGHESRLTDCTIRYSINRNLCDGNDVAGVVCDIGMLIFSSTCLAVSLRTHTCMHYYGVITVQC